MANYCSYFARFLFQRYQWVISTDADELLFFPNNLTDLLLELPTEFCAFKPEYAIAPVHAVEKEQEFCWRSNSDSWKSRKTYVYESEMFLKPLVARSPVTWGPGQHFIQETCTTLKEMVLLHAKHVDFRRLVKSTGNWKSSDQTANDKKFFPRVEELNQSESVEKYCHTLINDYLRRPEIKLPFEVHNRIFG